MASIKQVEANRKNALKSRGPTSVPGKMVSSRNSTRHGFYASNVLLPDEDREEFIRFARRLVMAHAPCGVLEEEQVRTIIETQWQLRRANLVDSELYQMFGFYEDEQRGVGTAFAHDASQANAFSKLTRYQSFLLRKLQIAEKNFAELKSRVTVLQPTVQIKPAVSLDSAKIPITTAAESQRNEINPLDIFKWLNDMNRAKLVPPPDETSTEPVVPTANMMMNRHLLCSTKQSWADPSPVWGPM